MSPAQYERLAFLVEELGEAIQMAGKTLRHGHDSTHADYGNIPNSELLAKELGDVFAAVDLLVKAGDISTVGIEQAREKKLAKIVRGTHFHHQYAVKGLT